MLIICISFVGLPWIILGAVACICFSLGVIMYARHRSLVKSLNAQLSLENQTSNDMEANASTIGKPLSSSKILIGTEEGKSAASGNHEGSLILVNPELDGHLPSNSRLSVSHVVERSLSDSSNRHSAFGQPLQNNSVALRGGKGDSPSSVKKTVETETRRVRCPFYALCFGELDDGHLSSNSRLSISSVVEDSLSDSSNQHSAFGQPLQNSSVVLRGDKRDSHPPVKETIETETRRVRCPFYGLCFGEPLYHWLSSWSVIIGATLSSTVERIMSDTSRSISEKSPSIHANRLHNKLQCVSKAQHHGRLKPQGTLFSECSKVQLPFSSYTYPGRVQRA